MAGPADLLDVLERPVLEAAPRLLSAVLTHRTESGRVAVRLTEVEAYDGANDPGSHAHRGQTRRNRTMFGPPGHLYVYFTYGMHHCCNVVVGAEGDPAAVLLRAGEVVEGECLARERRHGSSDRDLARGPARLCRALGIQGSDDGASLLGDDLVLELGEAVAPGRIATGPRVGLRQAADRPWRFWLDGDPTVSDYRPAKVLRSDTD